MEQIKPEACLAGVDPVITLRVTEVADGCVLAVSAAHCFSGEPTVRAFSTCTPAPASHGTSAKLNSKP